MQDAGVARAVILECHRNFQDNAKQQPAQCGEEAKCDFTPREWALRAAELVRVWHAKRAYVNSLPNQLPWY